MIKRNKVLLTALFLIAGFTMLFASGSKEESTNTELLASQQPLTVMCGVPTAPPALPLLRMIETNAMGDMVKLEYTLWSSPEQLVAMMQGSEGDMFALPLTVAAKLYNKGQDLQITNVNTWGVTYFTTTDPNLKIGLISKVKLYKFPFVPLPPIV